MNYCPICNKKTNTAIKMCGVDPIRECMICGYREHVKMLNDAILRANILELLELRTQELSDYLDISIEMAGIYLSVKLMLENKESRKDA